jgi:poly(3-hydroxybutyrate) depolymerase
MLRQLWTWLRRWIARLPGPAVQPGRFEIGSASAQRGRVLIAPLARPEREYLLYVPRGWSRWQRAPLIVLCHGCRQTPEDFAALTHIAERADREGWLVLMPRQAPIANPLGCWNWFDPEIAAGDGECAIVAAQIVAVRRHYRARRERVVVAGLSAGGALAAAMGLRHPRLVRGVFAHSALPCGAASTPVTALQVMRTGPDCDVERIGTGARAAQRDDPPLPVALLAVHGDRDDIVAPVNGVALVRQYLRFNAHPAFGAEPASTPEMPVSERARIEADPGRYLQRVDEWEGRGFVVRHVAVVGLGHAWSGGDGKFAYADPQGPDAVELLARFAREVPG